MLISFKRSTAKKLLRLVQNTGENTNAHPDVPVTSNPFRVGKTTTAHDKGQTEDVTLYYGETKGSETSSSITVEAYNRYADIETNKWVTLVWIGHGWELIAGEC